MRSDTASPARDAIGLIAGGGTLPLVLAKAVKARGHPLVCLALDDADASLVSLADHTYHVRFGQVEDVIAALRRHGARRVLMVGRVSRTDLVDRGDRDCDWILCLRVSDVCGKGANCGGRSWARVRA